MPDVDLLILALPPGWAKVRQHQDEHTADECRDLAPLFDTARHADVSACEGSRASAQ